MAEEKALVRKAAVEELKTYIQKNSAAVAQALPRIGLTPEALTRTAISQIYRNPVLMECDKVSVMRSIVEAASLGLSFSLGRAYLVPYRNTKQNRMEAQLIPGYQGLADIARRSGEISSINVQAVYDGDEFEYAFGLAEDILKHKPQAEPSDEKLTHVYAVVRFKDGGYQLVVMTKKQVDAIRRRSKSADFGPWKSDYAAMAKKTVVKQVLKLCPASTDLVRAIELDNTHETGQHQSLGEQIFGEDEEVITVEAEEEKPTKTAVVKEAMKAAKKAAEEVVDAEVTATAAAEKPRYEAVMDLLRAYAGKSVSKAEMALSEATAGRMRSIAGLNEDTPDAALDMIESWLKAQQ